MFFGTLCSDIFVLYTVAMFLLPPVPGVPVYLALGIVLPAQGHETLGEQVEVHHLFISVCSDESSYRLDWVNILQRCDRSHAEIDCKRDAAKTCWREPFPSREGAPICRDQFCIYKGHETCS